MSDVQTFTYRAPRFVLRLPVEFITAHGTLCGQTANLSDDGLLVTFQDAVLPGTRGRLRLCLESCALEFGAEVVYAELCTAGLHFLFASEPERRFLETLVKLLAREQTRRRIPIPHFAGL